MSGESVASDPAWVRTAYDLVPECKAVAVGVQSRARDSTSAVSRGPAPPLAELCAGTHELARTLIAGPDAGSFAGYAETIALLFERAMASRASHAADLPSRARPKGGA